MCHYFRIITLLMHHITLQFWFTEENLFNWMILGRRTSWLSPWRGSQLPTLLPNWTEFPLVKNSLKFSCSRALDPACLVEEQSFCDMGSNVRLHRAKSSEGFNVGLHEQTEVNSILLHDLWASMGKVVCAFTFTVTFCLMFTSIFETFVDFSIPTNEVLRPLSWLWSFEDSRYLFPPFPPPLPPFLRTLSSLWKENSPKVVRIKIR